MADRKGRRRDARIRSGVRAGRLAVATGRRLSPVWILLGCLLGCAPALAGGGPEVRVLLYEDAKPVRIGTPSALRTVQLASGRFLDVEGRGKLAEWKPQGGGPWRVGDRVVRGRIAVRAEAGRIQVLNRVGLEDYVASTVGGEMVSSWPLEALRAQAVAARTYVLHEARKQRESDWDVRSTAQSQVYGGLSAETPETRAAARSTAGQILTYRGQPILAVFHSTAGGRTAAASEVWGEDRPYLRVVEVSDEDDAPHTYWRAEFAQAELQAALEASGISVGRLESVEVVDRTASGRVEHLRLSGSRRRISLSGRRLRDVLGDLSLRSTLFEVRTTREGFAFVGSGYGHGVGMSQWGARAMARRGASYERILATFYPGTRLERWAGERMAHRSPVGMESMASARGRAGRSDGSAGSEGDEQ